MGRKESIQTNKIIIIITVIIIMVSINGRSIILISACRESEHFDFFPWQILVLQRKASFEKFTCRYLYSKNLYSKTEVKRPLSKRQKSGFQDQLSLNAGQKYCRMLQGEHSAILLAFIKLPFVIKIFVLSFLCGHFAQAFSYKGCLIRVYSVCLWYR